jgi:hypothetical protein
MAAVERVIRRARRRVTADKTLHGAGRGLVIGAAAALGVLAVDRGAGLPVPTAAYPLLAGAGLVAALALCLGKRPGGLATAVRLDRALGLKDRLGTAEAIRQGRARGELAGLARLQAERLAPSIDIRRATPIRVGRVWAIAVLLSAALGAGVAFLPAFGPRSGAATTTTSPQLAERRTEIVETINDAVADLDQETLDQASREDLQTLEALARQLTGEPATETELAEARDQSAAQLEQVADRLAEQAQRNLDAVDEVTRRFSGIDTPQEAPEPVEALAEALREGELEEAADRFDQLMDQRESMTRQSWERVAENLRQLGDQLEAPPDDRELAERADEIREALEDLGIDEQAARELLEPQDPRELEEALREQELDQEAMQQLAEDLERLHEQQQVREQADEHQRRLSDALQDAAEQLEQEAPQDAADQQPREERQPAPQQQPQPPDQSQDAPDETTGEPRSEGEQPQQTPGTVPQEAPEQTPDQVPQQIPGQTPDQVPRQIPGQTPDQAPPQIPGQAPDQAPQQQVPVAGDETGEQQPDRPSVGEALRQLERLRREATEHRQDGERLRRAARELAENLSEEEQRQLAERWLPKQDTSPGPGRVGAGRLDEQPPDGPPPFDTFEDVDLRGGDQDEGRIIAEWLGPEGTDGESGPPARGRALTRKAQTEAERAVEKSVVPSRYHRYIQRYFGRLEETVDRAANGGARSSDEP